MGRALSEDLRSRVLKASDAGMSARFGVGVSSAMRWIARAKIGELTARPIIAFSHRPVGVSLFESDGNAARAPWMASPRGILWPSRTYHRRSKSSQAQAIGKLLANRFRHWSRVPPALQLLSVFRAATGRQLRRAPMAGSSSNHP